MKEETFEEYWKGNKGGYLIDLEGGLHPIIKETAKMAWDHRQKEIDQLEAERASWERTAFKIGQEKRERQEEIDKLEKENEKLKGDAEFYFNHLKLKQDRFIGVEGRHSDEYIKGFKQGLEYAITTMPSVLTNSQLSAPDKE